MAPDTAAVERFVAARRPLGATWTANQQSVWKAAAREQWTALTIAAAFVAVRALHDEEEARV